MDYDEEHFDPGEYNKEEDENEDKKNDANNYEYYKMDENK